MGNIGYIFLTLNPAGTSRSEFINICMIIKRGNLTDCVLYATQISYCEKGFYLNFSQNNDGKGKIRRKWLIGRLCLWNMGIPSQPHYNHMNPRDLYQSRFRVNKSMSTRAKEKCSQLKIEVFGVGHMPDFRNLKSSYVDWIPLWPAWILVK